MRTSELTSTPLDYWVARAEGVKDVDIFWRSGGDFWTWDHDYGYHPSTEWGQGGPRIEKYRLSLEAFSGEGWNVETNRDNFGDTPLQAICRAVVRTKFGDEVPDEIGGT